MRRCQCKCGWDVFNSSTKTVVIDCPQCNSRITCRAGSRAPFMLGDHIERLLSYVGGRQFKAWYRRITGRQCGCDKRKQWLNRLFAGELHRPEKEHPKPE